MTEIPIRTALVGVDGSRFAEAALDTAVALCQRIDANLVVVHVAVPPVPLSSFENNIEHALRVEETARSFGEQVLDDARVRTRGRVNLTTEMHFGNPSEILIERARDLAVDLIVVGDRGLGLIDRLLLGSVSRAVVASAPCSVLVVRGPH